jgi:hypothetical protein
MLNRLPQQDVREYLEGQARAEHERCKTAENTALNHALMAGDCLIAIIEKYRKRDYGGKAALFERTCKSARTGRIYVFLAKHRNLFEEKPAEASADFSGHSIASALEYIRKLNPGKPPKPKSESIFSTTGEAQAQAAQKVGADSCSEADPREVIEEQKREIQRLNELVARLESQLEEDLTPIQLQAQIEKLGVVRFRQEVLPPSWVKSLTDQATPEKLIGLLEDKIPFSNRKARKHLCTLKTAIDQPRTINLKRALN